MRRIAKGAAALVFAAGAVIANGPVAQAGQVGALIDYQGCREGYVCIYPNASWNNGTIEHDYYTYGVHQLYDEYGVHRWFNNQTDGATTRLCVNRNGTDCTAPMNPWTYQDINLTPYNSIRLDP